MIAPTGALPYGMRNVMVSANVFIAGDAATGASLVMRAMAGGRKAAQQVDNYLCGK